MENWFEMHEARVETWLKRLNAEYERQLGEILSGRVQELARIWKAHSLLLAYIVNRLDGSRKRRDRSAFELADWMKEHLKKAAKAKAPSRGRNI